jgi:hypothetical protein
MSVTIFNSRPWRLVGFNAENLFLYFDEPPPKEVQQLNEVEWRQLSRSTIDNKSLKHVLEISRSIEELNPDFLMLCEVGGRESLANFSRYFLRDQYIPHLIEGNSDRGIDLGFLVKRDLPFKYDMISHKNRQLDFLYPHEKQSIETGYSRLQAGRVKKHRFSRDVVELRCFGESDEIPDLIIMLVHLKSPLDRDRIDPGGRDRRRAEQELLVKIYQEVRQEFPSGKVPVMIAGDFNGSIFGPRPDEEFESLRQTDLKCCLDIAGVPEDERITWIHVHDRRPNFAKQLDYILLSPELFSRVNRDETWVYRFRDESGFFRILPRNQNEKRQLPSDHYPVVLTLNSVKAPIDTKPHRE